MGNNESNMKNDLQKAEGKEKMGKRTEKGRGGLVTDPKPMFSELKENIAFIYICPSENKTREVSSKAEKFCGRVI